MAGATGEEAFITAEEGGELEGGQVVADLEGEAPDGEPPLLPCLHARARSPLAPLRLPDAGLDPAFWCSDRPQQHLGVEGMGPVQEQLATSGQRWQRLAAAAAAALFKLPGCPVCTRPSLPLLKCLDCLS